MKVPNLSVKYEKNRKTGSDRKKKRK